MDMAYLGYLFPSWYLAVPFQVHGFFFLAPSTTLSHDQERQGFHEIYILFSIYKEDLWKFLNSLQLRLQFDLPILKEKQHFS